jgi:hypothetical protein
VLVDADTIRPMMNCFKRAVIAEFPVMTEALSGAVTTFFGHGCASRLPEGAVVGTLGRNSSNLSMMR